MKQILIIEDDQFVSDYLGNLAAKINPNLYIHKSQSAEKSLEIAKTNLIEAFFIDIQLVDYSGLELAKQLREKSEYQFTPMIFITGAPTRELEAFHQVHCYEYIIKPFTEDEVTHVFRKILIDYLGEREDSSKKLYLDFKGIKQYIDMDSIAYVEYAFRKILIHTKNEIIKYRSIPLKKFKKQLSDRFIQVHQSFIINKDYINSIDIAENMIILQGSKDKIPIGKSYKKKAGEWLSDAN